MANAANLTKFNAGGSGDNVVPDGYIKSVEKVWIDSYAFTAAIPSDTVLNIAKIPANKKINSVELFFPSLSTGAAATGTTLSIGVATAAATAATLLLNAGEASTGILTLKSNAVDGINYLCTGGVNPVTVLFGRIATTTTAGTIKSIVRYT
jgi:hypothetical protein